MTVNDTFANRIEAGRELSKSLAEYSGREDVVVLGLSRGGVPVAFEVAQTLHAPLDVMVVRKLGVPGHEELAFGAIASGGQRILNKQMVAGMNLSEACVDEIIAREGVELQRRARLYNGNVPHLPLRDKTVILVDDGLATGSTMEVAIKAVSVQDPKEIVVAAPVAPAGVGGTFGQGKNVRCVFAKTVEPFYAVGLYYADFAETPNEVVVSLLAKARESTAEHGRLQAAGGGT